MRTTWRGRVGLEAPCTIAFKLTGFAPSPCRQSRLCCCCTTVHGSRRSAGPARAPASGARVYSMFSAALRTVRRYAGPAVAAASACALIGDAHLEAASDPTHQAQGVGPIIVSRRSLRVGDVYDFVASEKVSSSRTAAAYIERGPLVICSGGANADFTASVGEVAGERPFGQTNSRTQARAPRCRFAVAGHGLRKSPFHGHRPRLMNLTPPCAARSLAPRRPSCRCGHQVLCGRRNVCAVVSGDARP